jgi:hypothetical protein
MMDDAQMVNSDWSDWLQQEQTTFPLTAEELVTTSILMLQLNGRFLYLKEAANLAEVYAAERRILEALTRQGDTVFVVVGEDRGPTRLSYRLPNLETAVAFDLDSLRGLIRQWFDWASKT